MTNMNTVNLYTHGKCKEIITNRLNFVFYLNLHFNINLLVYFV